MLAVAAHGVHALLSFVANARDFICLCIFCYDFCAHGCFNLFAQRDGGAVHDHQRGEADLTGLNLLDPVYGDSFALGHNILLAAGLNYCFFAHAD